MVREVAEVLAEIARHERHRKKERCNDVSSLLPLAIFENVACGVELVHAFGVTADDTYQSAVPYFTSTGAHTNPLMILAAGAHFVLEPTFDQHEAIRRLAVHGTSVYFAVPSMLALIMRDTDIPASLPASLRTVVFGGSTTTAATLEAVAAGFPTRGLINSYGQTEAGPSGTVIGPDDILVKPGSVGRRGNGPNTEFRVVRADGTDATVDEVGEIVLRSPAVMRGYHRNPEETKSARCGRGGCTRPTSVAWTPMAISGLSIAVPT